MSVSFHVFDRQDDSLVDVLEFSNFKEKALFESNNPGVYLVESLDVEDEYIYEDHFESEEYENYYDIEDDDDDFLD